MVYLQRWHGWCHMKLLPSRRVLCTPYNHAPCHFMQSHVRKVYAYVAVTCHLHFWQNDWGVFLRATTVTLWWNEHQNKSQYILNMAHTLPTQHGTLNMTRSVIMSCQTQHGIVCHHVLSDSTWHSLSSCTVTLNMA